MNDMKRQGGSEAPAADYRKEKIALARERAAREAALHELHAENLKLQNQTLRAQRSQLHTQRLHDRFRAIYQSVLSIVALAVLAVIVYAVVSAARDQSVVVNQFQVPPDMAAQGDNGTVVASAFMDDLLRMQDSNWSVRPPRALSSAWSHDIQLQVPEAHISLGDIRRTLHHWLGHDIHVSGDVVQQGNQLTVTVHGSNFMSKTFTGSGGDLLALVSSAAEYVYGQAEPYLFATYLIQHQRKAEALQVITAAWGSASTEDRAWLLVAWSNTLPPQDATGKIQKLKLAIQLDPHLRLAYINLFGAQTTLGEEQAAYETGLRMMRETAGAPTSAPLVMDLPALHRLELEREATHGHGGQAPAVIMMEDALDLAQMHAYAQAELDVQTMTQAPVATADNPVYQQAYYGVQGYLAMDQQDYAQAAIDFGKSDTSPAGAGSPTDPFACRRALAFELSGQSQQADADLARGGRLVICYSVKARVAEHRGQWTEAQQDYQAAVNLAPSLPNAYESWGEALFRHGDYKDAILKFMAANQRGPHWCDPLEHWGEALAAEGQYQAAIEKTAEAAKYTPGWGALELHWGQALDQLGRHSEAQQHYQLAQQYGESLTATQHAELAKLLKT